MTDRRKVLSYFEENKEFFDTTVKENIEKYRKGKMRICVVDKDGKPVPDARIRVTQITHDFKFGANLFMQDELETEEKNRIYKDSFKSVFNMATLPFYWNSLEEEKGKLRYDKDSPKFYRRPPIDLCMEYCLKNGIEPREHALAYEKTFPAWLSDCTVDEIKENLERRYAEIAERYADKIPTIEVTNEMDWGHDRGVTAFYNSPDYIEWCFKTAEKYFPNNQLVINEYTEDCWGDNCRTTDKYFAYTEANILKGARIDAIGFQFHMFYDRKTELEKSRYLYHPICLYDHMDLYSSLVKHLQVTEITVPAYSNDPEDEKIQAELIRYLYTLWFSHPCMEQIIYWNLIDGYAYVADPTPEKIRYSQGNMSIGENVYYGGLLRYDMTPKPAFEALDHLINREWRTNIGCDIHNGELEFNGFFGKYEIEIEVNGQTVRKEFDLSKNKDNSLTLTL